VDGEPQLGVVYDPFTDRLYTAVKGEGAFCNDKLIQVNKYNLTDKEAVIGYDYSPTMPFNTLAAIHKLNEKCNVCGTGTFVHDAILVATGAFIAQIASGDRPYDIAAAKVIVESAGGRVTNIDGEDQRYDRDIKGAIISNGVVHNEIIKIIKEAK
jgi:fructose-1,6-bisphosphatase/inositol monophosphatase family enzyme